MQRFLLALALAVGLQPLTVAHLNLPSTCTSELPVLAGLNAESDKYVTQCTQPATKRFAFLPCFALYVRLWLCRVQKALLEAGARANAAREQAAAAEQQQRGAHDVQARQLLHSLAAKLREQRGLEERAVVGLQQQAQALGQQLQEAQAELMHLAEQARRLGTLPQPLCLPACLLTYPLLVLALGCTT